MHLIFCSIDPNRENTLKNSIILAKERFIRGSDALALAPYKTTDEIIEKVFQLNNESSFLKFYNYPKNYAEF